MGFWSRLGILRGENGMTQNVLIVHNYYQIPGGEDTVVANEKKMLEAHGHKVWLYTRSNAELKSFGPFQKLALPFTAIYSRKTYREVKKLIRDNNIDVLHVHNTLSLISPSVYYAGFDCKIPVIQTMHNFRFLCPGAEFYRDGKICEDCVREKSGLWCGVKHKCYRGSFLQTLASSVTLKLHRMLGTYRKLHYICLTEFNKEKLLLLNRGKKQLIDECQVFVKPNFTYDPTDTHDCKKFVTENKADYYIYVGRLEEIKGIHVILKAFRKNGKELYVIGSGTREEIICQYIAKHDLKNIHLMGYQPRERVDELIRGANAMIVAPQWYETFGMTVVEAFASHTPVIVGDMGNAGGLVEEGKNGWHFSYRSAADLERVVAKVDALGEEQRRQIGENAYRTYADYYSEEVNYRMLKEIYDTVCRK